MRNVFWGEPELNACLTFLGSIAQNEEKKCHSHFQWQNHRKTGDTVGSRWLISNNWFLINLAATVFGRDTNDGQQSHSRGPACLSVSESVLETSCYIRSWRQAFYRLWLFHNHDRYDFRMHDSFPTRHFLKALTFSNSRQFVPFRCHVNQGLLYFIVELFASSVCRCVGLLDLNWPWNLEIINVMLSYHF